MERRMYLFDRTARICNLRDDGHSRVEDAPTPPSITPLTFVGISNDIACFQRPYENSFTLCNATTAEVLLSVMFDPRDRRSVPCFGHTAEGQSKIVLLSEYGGNSYAMRVHRAANTTRGVTGGVMLEDGHFQPDGGWSEWLRPSNDMYFRLAMGQLARFVSNTCYWLGYMRDRTPVLMSFNVSTHAMGSLTVPIAMLKSRGSFGLGSGLDYGLAFVITWMDIDRRNQSVAVYSYIDDDREEWREILRYRTDIGGSEHSEEIAEITYRPLCIFNCRTDGSLHVWMLLNDRFLFRAISMPPHVNLIGFNLMHSLTDRVDSSPLSPAFYIDEPCRRIGDGRPHQPRQRILDRWTQHFQDQIEEFDDK